MSATSTSSPRPAATAGTSPRATPSAQDRTTVAIELEKVFEDLLPLLRTVQPEKLAATLNALASALEGRGTRLGENLVLVDSYFKEINPKLPVIQADISGLADLASTYAVAAPDLVRAANGADHHEHDDRARRRTQLAGFLAGTAGFANTTADFLDANGERIIQVGAVQRPTVEVFAKYSPQYPCIATAMTNWIPRIDEAWRDKTFHITLEITQQRAGLPARRGAALGRDAAARAATACPARFGTPGEALDRQPLRRRHQPRRLAAPAAPCPSMFAGTLGSGIAGADSGLAGTEERAGRRGGPAVPRTAQRRRPSRPCSRGRCCAERW